ncbi:MAG: ATP phosphoribosyltransferase [Myxococcaceae bacterium]|jgi:ATP phosphoribosyltransferase|nr:ATP phosphoribosyltransferase [Myxococcaceae bacterium]
MPRIALPNKGRLQEDVKALLDDAGLPIRGKSERSLTASLGGEFEAIFVRAQDIPEFVADGAADLGITGADLVAESGRVLTELLDLQFGKCRLVVAVRDESGVKSVDELKGRPRVASVFPRLTRAYFESKGIVVDVVPVSGAAEIAPHLGIADIVVDLTSTGSTLKVNGLREVGTVMDSTARLIGRDEVANQGWAQELTLALSSVLRARTQRYLMANVPKDRLDDVRERLPGLNGPTLSEVLGGGRFVAMHAVVPASSVYKTVAALKSLGCEGILVTRIERLMP